MNFEKLLLLKIEAMPKPEKKKNQLKRLVYD